MKNTSIEDQKEQKGQTSSVKYILYAGLALTVIIILLISFSQKVSIDIEIGPLEIKLTKKI